MSDNAILSSGLLSLCGLGLLTYSLWIAARGVKSETTSTPEDTTTLVVVIVGMFGAVLWIGLLPLYGFFGLCVGGCLLGEAVITRARHDIRPAQNDNRQRAFTTVQVVVVGGIVWVISWLVGFEWLATT